MGNTGEGQLAHIRSIPFILSVPLTKLNDRVRTGSFPSRALFLNGGMAML